MVSCSSAVMIDGVVEPLLGEQHGHRDRMAEIGLAATVRNWPACILRP